jgi:hypothetical protein
MTVSLPQADGNSQIVVGSLPDSMESFLEREALLTSLLDETTRCINSFSVRCFEPFGVMENEEVIFG